ncbi:putative lipoprotein [Olavius algarvensis associated proteobacterium Delta 3]|nr:putative lipoprotein [Olavius algarvensis associated proteobacterium Delta 3]
MPTFYSVNVHMRLLCVVLAGLTLVVSGCSLFRGKKSEKPALELASEGVDHYDAGNYKKAIEAFEQLRDWYPFSKYAILAELKIADSHYQLKQYEDAIFAYEEFENLHPRNEAVPYVVYQIGRSYFGQIDTVDRDQTTAQNALKTFSRLLQQHPNNAYARQAESHIKACLKSIAGHDYYVGLFYYKGKHYKAALKRFESIVIQYPDVGIHFEALQYITRCEEEIQKQEMGGQKALTESKEEAPKGRDLWEDLPLSKTPQPH